MEESLESPMNYGRSFGYAEGKERWERSSCLALPRIHKPLRCVLVNLWGAPCCLYKFVKTCQITRLTPCMDTSTSFKVQLSEPIQEPPFGLIGLRLKGHITAKLGPSGRIYCFQRWLLEEKVLTSGMTQKLKSSLRSSLLKPFVVNLLSLSTLQGCMRFLNKIVPKG